MDRGFQTVGFRTAIALDCDPTAVKTYNFNAKKKLAVEMDLSNATYKKIATHLKELNPELHPCGVIGGPPCQGFSRGNVTRHEADPRNLLPFSYAQILGGFNRIAPIDFFVLENVKGLTDHANRKRFKQVLEAFENEGFQVFHKVLDAFNFGVPQRRERLFIVGLNRKFYPKTEFEFPEGHQPPLTVRDLIADLPEATFYRPKIKTNEIPFHANHWTMRPKSKKFHKNNGTATTGRSFRRLLWDEPSPTVAYGHREIHVHPNGHRRLTIYEAMLLQGFPPTYRLLGNLSEQVTQVSNAVPPPVAEAVARQIMKLIKQRTKHEI